MRGSWTSSGRAPALPSALDELAVRVPSGEADYLLRVSEYDYEEAFLPLEQRGSETVELGRAVHSKHFSVFVGMSGSGASPSRRGVE
jgi:hypothetical protein